MPSISVINPTASPDIPTNATNNVNMDPVSQWEQDAPPGEDRRSVANQIREASSSGHLELFCTEISSLPPLPEGILTVRLQFLDDLKNLPALPQGCTSLSIDDCPKITSLPDMPDSLNDVKLSGCTNLTSLSSLPNRLERLSLVDCHELSFLPLMPNSLKALSISKCKNLILPPLQEGLEELIVGNVKAFEVSEGNSQATPPKIPNSLKQLNIEFCNITTKLPPLPDGLQQLKIIYSHSISNLPTPLPKELKRLEIHDCERMLLPTVLPDDLNEISLNCFKKTKWDISPQSLPPNINIKLYNVDINPECYNLDNVTFSGVGTRAAKNFNKGDILYGLATPRAFVGNMIYFRNGFLPERGRNDIVVQNTLTNAVWSRDVPDEFKSDEEIKSVLKDGQRGLDFKSLMKKHVKYNVTTRAPSLSDASDQSWMRTSKAGLEFQTTIQKKSVLFCVDGLMKEIPDIAGKKGSYGDAITAHELRWLYRHRDDENVQKNVKFYLNGNPVSHEYVFNAVGWDTYHPKSLMV
ncbi:hypothetical protein [Aeromonas salmonicida]|uniref:hypothetical protein n=1 Tax=Aeromonas salmonicida TaxID=645 RepID=UPI0023308138|nr:hypothetical protein [Aeromonas salmonicida]WCH23630.1 hypothetical protein ONZ54_04495 [Aeromonas salmonicida]